MGSVYASLYASTLTATLPHALPTQLAAIAHQSVGAAFQVSAQLGEKGQGALAAAVHAASVTAFQHGLSVACVVAGGVAVGGALLSVIFIPAHPEPQQEPEGSAVPLESMAQLAE